MKKGISLVELLVVMCIIGILCTLIIPNLYNYRNDILNKEYESKVKLINLSALEWAYDNIEEISSTCYYVKVEYLINNGYLVGDSDKTEIINPITNESMNNEEVCIQYKNNKLESCFDNMCLEE